MLVLAPARDGNRTGGDRAGAPGELWLGAPDLVLPNIIIATSIVFAIAAATRSTLATWVGGVLVYALYFITAMLVDSPLMAGTSPPTAEALARAAIMDPFGLSAFFEQTRYWTPAERNTRLLSLSGHFLGNRLLWLAVAARIVGLTGRLFRMRAPARRSGRRLTTADSQSTADSRLPVSARQVLATQAAQRCALDRDRLCGPARHPLCPRSSRRSP